MLFEVFSHRFFSDLRKREKGGFMLFEGVPVADGFTFEGAEPIEISERVSYLPNNLSLLVSDSTTCS